MNGLRHQKESLHALFDQTLEEAVPERLLRTTQRQRSRWGCIAAALSWLAIGGIAGFAVRGAPANAPAPTMPPLRTLSIRRKSGTRSR